MKVRGKIIKLTILTGGLFLVGAALIGGSLNGNFLTDEADGLVLAKPALAQTTGASFLEQEAGIAAYVNAGQGINLAKAKAAYRTLEKETESYVIGSVALPDYPVSEDVHCYVHKDGWIVTYYMKEEPTSKIIDWLSYSPGNISTKLKLALDVMANSLGLAITNLKYYHFDYPNANKLMIVAKSRETMEPVEQTHAFDLTIPDGVMVFERAWSFFAYIRPNTLGRRPARLSLNERLICELDVSRHEPPQFACGRLTVDWLPPNVVHTVSLYTNYSYARAGITLIYKEP